ncbi:hypothetical protein [Fictibacillus sp. JL2B1089]|uniref:hypothetical protein n=1 Tax=Fictibacillus sp. JL2B1089 TaxID=3399565 RepID=UPI003A89CBBB
MKKMYDKRYGILFAVKSNTSSNRKVTVMDLKLGRQITFTVDEIEGLEMEEDLKVFMRKNLEKLDSGYWDYTGTHKK